MRLLSLTSRRFREMREGVFRVSHKKPYFLLEIFHRTCIMLIMKYLLNYYSIFVAKAFRALYMSSSWHANRKAMDVLEHYKDVRRCLPLMHDGRHWGNHKGSKQEAFKATQGVGK